MNKMNLLKSAEKLNQVNEKLADEYIAKREQLVVKINERMLKRPDIEKLVGKTNLVMMKDNHNNHVKFIGSILKYYKPEVFVNTVLWVFRTYRNRGFHVDYWKTQLYTWIEIINVELTPEAYSEIHPYYKWMQENVPLFIKLSDETQKEIDE